MTSTTEPMTDLHIAQQAVLHPIFDIADAAGIPEEALEQYGRYKAKVDVRKVPDSGRAGRVVLVTAVSPTPAGEGKSTTTVGLADSLNRAFEQEGTGRRSMIALREPSLGPTLGMKGGATGGGYSQVLPMDEINLHFTGDFHAINSANNALCALIDNHIYQGNVLNIDPRRITFKRVLDMNDRALREVVIGLGGPTQGVPRQDGFDITVASEIMAVFCLATDLNDLKSRIGKITFGYNYDRQPLTVAGLGVEGVLTLLLKEAIKPNLVQTLAGTAALVHGGPFANIAHGCNSVIATSLARRRADVVVTEAGFGADLGAEKYMDIKSRFADVAPSAVVIVATIRALKMHGGVPKTELSVSDVAALRRGVTNLARHISNVRQFGLDPVVSINRFTSDSEEELDWLVSWCESQGVSIAIADVWGRGGGGDDLAAKVLAALDAPSDFRHLYELELPVKEKIELIAQKIYGAERVEFSSSALKRIAEISANGWDSLPVCMAKTQYSFSDDASLLGAPSGFVLHVRDLVPKTGAGFIVALTGAVMTMPGLPKQPAALKMDVDAEGNSVGLS